MGFDHRSDNALGESPKPKVALTPAPGGVRRRRSSSRSPKTEARPLLGGSAGLRAGLASLGRHGATAPVFLLLGAFAAIMLTGGAEQGSWGIFLGVAGLAMVVFPPKFRIGWPLWTCVAGLVVCSFLPLLPHDLIAKPTWRQIWEASPIPLGPTISVAPRITAAWAILFGLSLIIGLFALSQELRRAQRTWIAAGAAGIIGLYALVAMYASSTGWNPFGPEYVENQKRLWGGQTFGFFPNRNHTAAFLVLGSILSVGVLGMPKVLGHWSARVLAGVSLAACSVALVFHSISRAGILFLGLGVALWVAGLGRRHRTRLQLTVMALATIAGLIVFIGSESAARKRVFTLVGLEESERAKYEDQLGIDSSATQGRDVLFDLRLLVYHDALKLIADYPWTGAGMGCFPYIFGQYRDYSLLNNRIIHPESDWLQLLADVGIPGAILFAAFLGIIAALAMRDRNSDGWPLRWGMICAALTILLHGMVDVPNHRIQLGWWVMLIAAFGIQPGGVRTLLAGRGERVFFVLAGLCALACSTALIRAEWFGGPPSPSFEAQAAEVQVAQKFQEGSWDEAAALAYGSIARWPVDEALYFQLGCLLLNYENAEPEAATLFASERLLNPSWSEVSRRQGEVWLYVDPTRSAPVWLDGIRRQQQSDARTQFYAARGLYRWCLKTAAAYPEVQKSMLDLSLGPDLLWIWMQTVPPELSWFAFEQIATNAEFIDSLSAYDRRQFIAFWIRSGPFDRLLEFAAVRSAEWQEALWPVTVRAVIEDGRFDQAFLAVAERFEVPLNLPKVDRSLVSTSIAGASVAPSFSSTPQNHAGPALVSPRLAGSSTAVASVAPPSGSANPAAGGPVMAFTSPSLASAKLPPLARAESATQKAAAQGGNSVAISAYYHSGLKLADLAAFNPLAASAAAAQTGMIGTRHASTASPATAIAGVPPQPDPVVEQFTFYWQRGNEIAARRVLREGVPGQRLSAEGWRLRAALAAQDKEWRRAWDSLFAYLASREQGLW